MSRRRPPQYDLPKAAPGPLRLVQVLVNTTDGHERELLPEWLEERGVAATPAALARAREVREALRALLIANNERLAVPADAAEELERAADARTLSIRFSRRRSSSRSRTVSTARSGRVLAAALACMRDGSWTRLKACRNCHWAFYDESRNRSAAWCSMQLCGNRLKTRRRKAARMIVSHRGGGMKVFVVHDAKGTISSYAIPAPELEGTGIERLAASRWPRSTSRARSDRDVRERLVTSAS